MQRFDIAELRPFLSGMLTALFGAFQKPESGENEYVMRCVLKLITFVGKEVSFQEGVWS